MIWLSVKVLQIDLSMDTGSIKNEKSSSLGLFCFEKRFSISSGKENLHFPGLFVSSQICLVARSAPQLNITKSESMLKIEPITPHIGARIYGLGLAACGADELDKVYQALITHQVIFLDGQTLSPEQHMEIAERFGTLEPAHPFFPHVESAPQVSLIETT